jgi:hypothetical protein
MTGSIGTFQRLLFANPFPVGERVNIKLVCPSAHDSGHRLNLLKLIPAKQPDSRI